MRPRRGTTSRSRPARWRWPSAAVLDEFQPDMVFALNGLFASERVVRELALSRGMRVATYEMGPRSDTLFFSTDAPACDYDTTGVWNRCASAR